MRLTKEREAILRRFLSQETNEALTVKMLLAEIDALRAEKRELEGAWDALGRSNEEIDSLRSENQHLRDDILKVNYSERLLLAEQERDMYKSAAESWMKDYDALKEKHEPTVMVTSESVAQAAKEQSNEPT